MLFGCDECYRIDDPPPSYESSELGFLLLQKNPSMYFIKLSNDDNKGLYLNDNVDFIDAQGTSLKDSLFYIQDREIVFKSNKDVNRENLIQEYQIIFSQDFILDLTIEHIQYSDNCLGEFIGGINIIANDESYSLVNNPTIYL